MPVNLDFFGFQCFNELKNGINFNANSTDFTRNLVGNVGEKIKVQYQVNISQTSFTQSTEQWELLPAIFEIRRASGSFLEDEIQVGYKFGFYNNWSARENSGVVAEFEGLVSFISSDGLTINYTIASGTPTSSGLVSNVGLIFDQLEPENFNTAVFLRFGLLDNDETFNYNSKTTEALQVYYASELSTITSRTGESLGKIKDWVSGEVRVFASNNIQSVGEARYLITHEFVLNPFYTLAFRSFLLSNTLPPLFAGDSSLKYAVELEFRKSLSDTGSAKIGSLDSLPGFVGWYGENFNGLNPDYEVLSVSYEDSFTGDPLNSFNINTETKVTVVINKFSGDITDYSCGVYVFKALNSENDYVGTETSLLDNFLYKSEVVPSPATSSANITTNIVNGDLIIEYSLDYTTAEKLRLSKDDEYVLLVQIEDPTISAGNSDRIMLLADFTNYSEIDFVADFINVESYNFVTHGKGIDLGTPTTTVCNEDNITLNAVIGADVTKNVVVNSISANLIAYNTLNGESFSLDTYTFNIGEPLFSNNLQQIEVDTTRGYPLIEGDPRNFVKVSTIGQTGNFQYFSILLGQKIKWQEWLLNSNVDNVFFDSSRPNNNLNFKSSNYSNELDYEIRLSLTINVSGIDTLGRSLTGDFTQLGGQLTVLDYGESADVNGIIETFSSDSGQPLGGDILFNGDDTLFRCTFQNAGAITYAIHRIEPSLSPGDGILELSSIDPSVEGNILKPIEGEDFLKLTFNGSQLVTECLISGDLVQEGVTYKLSARAGNLF